MAGDRFYEILSVDTASSTKFFRALDATSEQNESVSRLAEQMFKEACERHGGEVAGNWEFDGGRAYFEASAPHDAFTPCGRSIEAALWFIGRLGDLARQTRTAMSDAISLVGARRSFRLVAHYGAVHRTSGGNHDHGPELSAFLKHTKELTTRSTDVICVTSQLHARLSEEMKGNFGKIARETSFEEGTLVTTPYRWQKSTPSQDRLNLGLMDAADAKGTMNDLPFLRSRVAIEEYRRAALNTVVKDLIENAQQGVRPKGIQTAVIRALHAFFVLVYPSCRFRVVFWRRNAEHLRLIAAESHDWPCEVKTIPIDHQYLAARCSRDQAAFAVPDVEYARQIGSWYDRSSTQDTRTPTLRSTLQLPVYWIRKKRGFADRERLGVVSIDCDTASFFRFEDTQLWQSDLTTFTAYLALSERLRETRNTQSKRTRRDKK